MTEVERRRLELLRETRKVYNEHYSPPAIHPRYQTAYQSLYGEHEKTTLGKSNFFLRTVIAVILFVLFFFAESRIEQIGNFNCSQIVFEIQKDLLGQ